MKPLPYISIFGVGKTPEERLQSLIEFEPVLQKIGYVSDEEWNEESIKKHEPDYLIGTQKAYSFHNHRGARATTYNSFSVLDQQAIIDYVLNYEAK